MAVKAEEDNRGFVEKLMNGAKNLREVVLGRFVNRRYSEKWSSLHHAAFHGEVDVVSTLLSAGALPDPVDRKGNTPLLMAMKKEGNSHSQRLNIAQMLLEAGANVNFTNEDGETSLSHACARGDHETVKLMLSHGADPTVCDKHGYDALLYAMKSQNVDSVRHLLNTGSIDLNLVYKEGLTLIHDNDMEFHVRTALHVAIVLVCNVDMFRCLLDHGADPKRSNGLSLTHKTWLYFHLAQGKRIPELRLLLERGSDLANFRPRSLEDPAPLLSAAYYGDAELLSLLLEYRDKGSVDLEYENFLGYTALLAAAQNSHTECVKLLLEAGANVHHTCRDGRTTPLGLCLSEEPISMASECVQILIDAGAKVGNIIEEAVPDDGLLKAIEVSNPAYINNHQRELMCRWERAKRIVKYRILYEDQHPLVTKRMEPGSLGKSIKIRDYCETCKAEIASLKSSFLDNSISYYDLLTADVDFHKRVRNKRVYEAFDDEKLENCFTVYSEDLRERYLRLNERHKIWEESVEKLSRYLKFDPDTYYSVIHNILNYLEDKDLQSLAKSGDGPVEESKSLELTKKIVQTAPTQTQTKRRWRLFKLGSRVAR